MACNPIDVDEVKPFTCINLTTKERETNKIKYTLINKTNGGVYCIHKINDMQSHRIKVKNRHMHVKKTTRNGISV